MKKSTVMKSVTVGLTYLGVAIGTAVLVAKLHSNYVENYKLIIIPRRSR